MSKPLVLNNGVLLQETKYDAASHLDKAHLTHLNKDQGPVTNLGMVEPFVNAGYKVNPFLWNFSGGRARKIAVKGNIYTWQTPIPDGPCYIVEDITTTDKPGWAGEKFKIKVNTNKYDNGYIISVDQQSPFSLLITEDEIEQSGEHWILTVRLLTVNQADKWMPKNLLKAGTKFFPIGTNENEQSQIYSSIPTITGGVREYFNYVGMGHSQLHYSVTRDAAYSKIKSSIVKSIADYRKVVEMYVFRPGSLGYDMSLKGQMPSSVSKMYKKEYGINSDSKLNYDTVLRSWVPEIELTGIALLKMYNEQMAMWGTGGKVQYDGTTPSTLPLGLFHQLNMGSTHTYNLYNFSLQRFEFILANRLSGRRDFNHDGVITIKTGRGGIALIQNYLRQMPGNLGMVSQSKDYIRGLGGKHNKSLHLDTPEFTSWTMSNGMGIIKFEHAPALDPHNANDIVNPIVPLSKAIGGHRLSSYMFIIDDLSNSVNSDNIYELYCEDDWDVTKRVITGKLDYMGRKNFKSSGHHPGFEVFLTERYKAYWVKDPTKSLLIKPINPITGKPIYANFNQY